MCLWRIKLKTKYETLVEPNLNLIERWKRNGASDEKIAERLGVAYSTFRVYIKQFSALSAVLKKGKEIVDTEVENALLKRALGFDYEEVTREQNKNGELVVTKIVKKHIAPDITAQIFWLKNRCPAEWKDKREITGEVEHKVDVPQNIKSLPPEVLRSIATGVIAPPTEEFLNEQNGSEQQ